MPPALPRNLNPKGVPSRILGWFLVVGASRILDFFFNNWRDSRASYREIP